MGGYSYLDGGIKSEISSYSEKTILLLGDLDPPINYDQLFQSQQLTLKHFTTDDERITSLATHYDLKNLESLRGVLFVDERKILVKEEGYEKRKNFVYAHELGHWMLPWHKAILFQCTQFDLSAAARKQLEQEANFFAGEMAFYGKKFIELLLSSEVSLSNYIALSDLFNMSMESTLRRAIELELRSCALLILDVDRNDEKNFLKVKYEVYSNSFEKKVGSFKRRHTFDRNHELSKIIADPLCTINNIYNCEIIFGGTTTLKTEVMYNNYNVIALFYKP